MSNIIVAPFAALLRWCYAFTGSYGLSIIIFALVVKLVLLPFQMKSKRSMIRMGQLTKQQQELQAQYSRNQQKYQEELAKLYQEEGVNPMGGCLWSFLPLFIMLPLYQIIYRPITYFMGLSDEAFASLKETALALGYDASTAGAYEQIGITDFIHRNWSSFQGTEGLIDVNFSFLNLDLSMQPQQMLGSFSLSWECIGLLAIPILAAVSQFASSKVMALSNGQTEQQGQMKMMNLLMPLTSIWFCFMMPAAMGVYWIINSVLMAVQEVVLGKFYTNKIKTEELEEAEKRAEARRLRMEEARKKEAQQRERDERKIKRQQQKSGEKRISTNEAGRVGDRPYARGRSYQEDRYD